MTRRSAVPLAVLALNCTAVPVSAQEPIAATVQLCASCHGREGRPADPSVPIISGQQPGYIRKQLMDYRSGDRDSEIMSSIAQSLSERQIAQIADYFGAAAWPRDPAAAPAVTPAAVLACQACHNRDLKGAAGAPRLAGQSAPYIVETMTAFASGERANNPQMSALMRSLSPADRNVIADYLARLP
jgi:cytochrome c553